MKPFRRNLTIASCAIGLVGWLLWQFSPVQPILAIAQLSDPARLATLGERGANPRLNKIVYWLHAADHNGMPPGTAVQLAQIINWTSQPRAALVKASLLRNWKIAEELGLFTPENLDRLRHGKAG